MSDSEDDDYTFYGTQLEQFDEDAVPRKKPITVEEQIATDKHGRRRFHGAFTGGFSAGFFNSVGSLEGWKPSTFKSSRSDRSSVHQQLPSHFMDDEDTDEFGIAPQVLKTKSDYASAKRNQKKRDREAVFNSGPIPGVPVLESILKPAKHTIGILLLIKMGWRPGEDIGEKLERRKNKSIQSKEKTKVYGCARGPQDNTYTPAPTQDSDSDLEDEIYRELGKKAPKYVLKEDTMGLGYKGLDRNALSFGKKSVQPVTIRDQFNRSIKVAGQAFGVGAFEEEDDDIYSTDDKSQYDFSLEPLNQRKKAPKNKPAITDGTGVILGFVRASFKETLPHYPPPLVPASFTGQHVEKQSRFDLGPTGENTLPRRQQLDADVRSVILDSEQLPVRIKEEKLEDEPRRDEISVSTFQAQDKSKNGKPQSWKPFSSDPLKQGRYEKYLNLIKIGAKDLVHTVLLNTMSDLERESELREFECASRLYSGKLVSDRFTHGQNLEDETNIKQETVSTSKEVRRRITTEWVPHPLVSKRFNLKPPDNAAGTTLQKVAENKKRPKFSVFDFLNTSKTADLGNMIESNARSNSNSISSLNDDVRYEVMTGSVDLSAEDSTSNSNIAKSNNSTDPASAITTNIIDKDEEFDEPEDKMDLFKAIFLDSDSDNEDEKQDDKADAEENVQTPEKRVEPVNVLRNTSPPRGIFANLDLDKLSNWKASSKSSDLLKLTDPPQSIFEAQKDTSSKTVSAEDEPQLPEDCYGPVLPAVQVDKRTNYINLKLDLKDDRWVEKTPKEKHHKSKHHHKKKHKKDKRSDKHKKKKKKKRRSSSESESSSNSD